MTNKSKQIGTKHETAIVKYLQKACEYPYIHRRPLSGSKDTGDIIIEGLDIILEVKSGKQCDNPSRSKMEKWLHQTVVELKNSQAKNAYLIIHEYSRPVKDSKVYCPDLISLRKEESLEEDNLDRIVRCRFCYLDDFAEYISGALRAILAQNKEE